MVKSGTSCANDGNKGSTSNGKAQKYATAGREEAVLICILNANQRNAVRSGNGRW
jgi:hypothetical protein